MYNPLHLPPFAWYSIAAVYALAIGLFLRYVTADEYAALNALDRYQYRRWILAGIVVAVFSWPLVLIGFTIGATLVLADEKNRSRGWAALTFVLGPIPLIVLLFLPRVADTSSLHLENPLP